MNNKLITLARDVEASIVPAGDKVTLAKGVPAYITQSLGGSYTVVVKVKMRMHSASNQKKRQPTLLPRQQTRKS